MSLKFQKRLAASVLSCGKNKVWLDPMESNEIAMANSSESKTRPGPARTHLGGGRHLLSLHTHGLASLSEMWYFAAYISCLWTGRA